MQHAEIRTRLSVDRRRKERADDGSDQARRCALRRGADRVQLDDRQAASGHRAVCYARRRARCAAARHEPGLRRRGARRRTLRRRGLPQRQWPCNRRSPDEGHPGRRRGASGARRCGRHVGRVRPGHAGARPGDDRWTCVDDRRRRPDARWRVGMDGAGLGPQLRQPRLGRPRDRRRQRGHGERRREPRSLLGPARRRRQLRCCHLVRVQAARAGSAGDRRPDALARRCRRRRGAPVPGLRRRGARRAGHGPCLPHRSTGRVRARPPPGHDAARHRRPLGRRRRRGCRGDAAAQGPRARGRPRRSDALRRLPVHDRRPARHAELLVSRLPRQLPRRRARRLREVRLLQAVAPRPSNCCSRGAVPSPASARTRHR